MPDEPPRTPEVILGELADVVQAWLTVLSNWGPATPENVKWQAMWLAHTTYCYLSRVPDLLRELGAVEPYDFDKWVADLSEKGKPDAKELAEKVFTALDNLAGAG